MIWKGVTQDIPRGSSRGRGKKKTAAPICDIMADTLSVLYGTTENRNDIECYGRCGAVQRRDLTQFNSLQCARLEESGQILHESHQRGEMGLGRKDQKIAAPISPSA